MKPYDQTTERERVKAALADIEDKMHTMLDEMPKKLTWIEWLRQLLCVHEWDCIAGFEVFDPKPVRFRCLKCGKEEGL